MPRQKRHKRRTQRGGGFLDGLKESLMGPDTPDYTSSYIDSKEKKDGLLSNIFGPINLGTVV
jgi:hypothetical protein